MLSSNTEMNFAIFVSSFLTFSFSKVVIIEISEARSSLSLYKGYWEGEIRNRIAFTNIFPSTHSPEIFSWFSGKSSKPSSLILVMNTFESLFCRVIPSSARVKSSGFIESLHVCTLHILPSLQG